MAKWNVLVSVVGENSLYSIRLLTPCFENNLSQASFSSCHPYSRTLREESPGVCHIKSKRFILASPVVLSNWFLPLLHQQTGPLQSFQIYWLTLLHIFFFPETSFKIFLLILFQLWIFSLFQMCLLKRHYCIYFHSMPAEFSKISLEIGFPQEIFSGPYSYLFSSCIPLNSYFPLFLFYF